MSDEPTTPEAAEPPVIEGKATELAPATHVAGQTAALIRPTSRPTREALVPLDADAVIEGMRAYQDLLPRLLDDSDYQGTGSDRFVKKSGWRKIARAFNLSVEIVSISILRDERGRPERAECIARALAPNGQIQDADGYCSTDEFTGRRADDPKMENTLRATATTRAKNRAIADLVGMGEISAEEMENTGGGNAGPPFGPAVDEAGRGKASQALTYLLDADAGPTWNAIVEQAGYMPQIVADSIRRIARVLAERNPEPEPEEEPEIEGDGSAEDPDPVPDEGDPLTYTGGEEDK